MSALTTVRNTEYKRGDSKTFLVAGGVEIFQGALVVLDAGYAKPGFSAADLFTVGMACHSVDNLTGEDGYAEVTVGISAGEREFYWNNDEADPVTQADVGSDCYVLDDQTVTMTASGHSVAGKVLGFRGTQVTVRHPI